MQPVKPTAPKMVESASNAPSAPAMARAKPGTQLKPCPSTRQLYYGPKSGVFYETQGRSPRRLYCQPNAAQLENILPYTEFVPSAPMAPLAPMPKYKPQQQLVSAPVR